MSSAVNSNVPKIVCDGDNTVLTVHAAGFTEGKPVEVYGFVTQDSGAYATFSKTSTIPASGDVEVPIPSGQLNLKPGEPVTVVTWVSEVWPSMLTAKNTATSTGGTTASGTQAEAEWEINPDAEQVWRAKGAALGWRP